MLEFVIRKANDADIPRVKGYGEKFNLDIEGLIVDRIIVLEHNGVLAGFGRHKNFKDFTEIATIGVLEEFRKHGAGKMIVRELIGTSPSPEIWLTTIIPAYFEQFGFTACDNAPNELILKAETTCRKLCKSTENVVFMKHSTR